MINQAPSSISQLMLHLSRKYSHATLDSPRQNTDYSNCSPQQSQIFKQEQDEVRYTPIDNSYFSEVYGIGKSKSKQIKKQEQRHWELRQQKWKKDGQKQNNNQYTEKLQKLNQALKQQLLAVRQLMREQSDVIQELYGNHK